MSVKKLCIVFTFCMLFFSCKKNENPAYVSLNTYYPLKTGTSYTYRLDSTLLAPFGSALIVHSYLLKDSIESTFNDNSGRLSYLVLRYITDTLNTKGWQYLSTYYITPTNTTVEVVDDNNLRFIKLAAPAVNNFSWAGNTFIDTKSTDSPVPYLDGWMYTYKNQDQPYNVQMGTVLNTLTVLQDSTDIPDVPFSTSLDFYQHIYSVEVYAQNIGMVYKDFIYWTWQTNPQPAYQDGSYGFRLSLVSFIN